MTPDELAAQIAALREQVADLEQAVVDLQAARASTLPDAPPVAATPERVYDDLAAFVTSVIAPLYAAHLTSGAGGGWCPQWADHHEAVVRLAAIWTAWETLHVDEELGMARWLRDVADPQMDRLRDRDRGPFRACSDGRHLLPGPLPSSA